MPRLFWRAAFDRTAVTIAASLVVFASDGQAQSSQIAQQGSAPLTIPLQSTVRVTLAAPVGGQFTGRVVACDSARLTVLWDDRKAAFARTDASLDTVPLSAVVRIEVPSGSKALRGVNGGVLGLIGGTALGAVIGRKSSGTSCGDMGCGANAVVGGLLGGVVGLVAGTVVGVSSADRWRIIYESPPVPQPTTL